jgi:hypothetical protein
VLVAARVGSARRGDEQGRRMREAFGGGGRGRPASEDERGRGAWRPASSIGLGEEGRRRKRREEGPRTFIPHPLGTG